MHYEQDLEVQAAAAEDASRKRPREEPESMVIIKVCPPHQAAKNETYLTHSTTSATCLGHARSLQSSHAPVASEVLQQQQNMMQRQGQAQI